MVKEGDSVSLAHDRGKRSDKKYDKKDKTTVPKRKHSTRSYVRAFNLLNTILSDASDSDFKSDEEYIFQGRSIYTNQLAATININTLDQPVVLPLEIRGFKSSPKNRDKITKQNTSTNIPLGMYAAFVDSGANTAGIQTKKEG